VVANRQVSPVRLDGVVVSANHDTNVVGVVEARVEIGVVADSHGQLHLDIISLEKSGLLHGVGHGAFLAEDSLESFSKLDSVGLTSGSEVVEGALAEVVVLGHGEEGAVK